MLVLRTIGQSFRHHAFWALIIGGFFVWIVLPLGAISSCPPNEESFWTVKGEKEAGQQQRDSESFDTYLKLEKHKAQGAQRHADGNDLGNYVPSWLCYEAKFTDLLIAYFTYCLVVVGWFTMRGSEKTIRAAERAYVFVRIKNCGQYETKGMTRTYIDYRFFNYGRTPAVLTSIEVELKSLKEPPDNSKHNPVWRGYILTGKEENGWCPDDGSLVCDTSAPPDPAETVWFYGSVIYEDVFGVECVTRFRYKYDPDNTSRFVRDGDRTFNERT